MEHGLTCALTKKSYVGQPALGGHSMGLLLLILVMLLLSQNFSALLSFLEIACIDYKRREVLLVHLKDQIRPQLSCIESGAFKILPKPLDLKLGNNAIAYLSLRQTIRELGKKYRLRLQWLVSYAIILQVAFLATFLSLAFGRVEKLKVEHYYCILLAPIISAYVLRALAYADITNNVPADELHFIRLQTISARRDLNSMLQRSLGTNYGKDSDRKNAAETRMLEVEVEKNVTNILTEVYEFIKQDNALNPIQILNMRADYKLLQAFVFGLIGFLVTLVELAGIELA